MDDVDLVVVTRCKVFVIVISKEHGGDYMEPKKIAEKAFETVKEGADYALDKANDGKDLIGDKAVDAKNKFDVYRYRPIFKKAINNMSKNMPELIRVIDDDRMKSVEACKNAVGFRKTINDMDVMGLFPEVLSSTGVTFYPNQEQTLYCKDPFNNNLYISLDDYYTYLKEARVNELETVAQALGAKYLKVEYKVEKSSLFQQKGKGKVKAKPKGVVDVKLETEHEKESKEFSKVDVLAECKFDGEHEPVEPKLNYLQGVNSIETLIKMRVNPDSQNRLNKKQYRVECKNLSGLKVNDAIKIDGAIKKMKINSSNSLTVQSMAEQEEKTTLEFTIEF